MLSIFKHMIYIADNFYDLTSSSFQHLNEMEKRQEE